MTGGSAEVVVARVFPYQPFLLDLRREATRLTMQLAAQLRGERITSRRLVVALASADGPGIVQRAEWLPTPTADLHLLAVAAQHLLNRLYEPGASYRELRVGCEELAPVDGAQLSLLI